MEKVKPLKNDLISIHINIYVDTCFFGVFFFKEEKDLPFSNTCRPSSFAETNLILGNLI